MGWQIRRKLVALGLFGAAGSWHKGQLRACAISMSGVIDAIGTSSTHRGMATLIDDGTAFRCPIRYCGRDRANSGRTFGRFASISVMRLLPDG